MSDHGPDDIIDYSGAPRSISAQHDEGFRHMKAKLVELKLKKLSHVAPMVRVTAIKSYEEGLNDAFSVFAQVVDVPSNEELSPG